MCVVPVQTSLAMVASETFPAIVGKAVGVEVVVPGCVVGAEDPVEDDVQATATIEPARTTATAILT